MRTLHGFILTASVAVSLIFFGGGYWVFTRIHGENLRQASEQHAATVARMAWQSMSQLMLRGWSRAELLDYLETTRQAVAGAEGGTPSRFRLFRADAVVSQFGRLDQEGPDALINEVLRQGRPLQQSAGNLVRHVFPLRAEARCLVCHTQARAGEVLGVMDVSLDLGPALAGVERRYLYNLLLLAPLPFLVAFLVVWHINRRLARAMGTLRDGVENLNRVADLRQLKFTPASVGFREIDAVFDQVAHLGERLRGVAVDKDLLEFEIRLMEKFIITSEVVRDWHEYVKELLVEINKIIQAYTLFCVFKVEDELFSLEIFWRQRPSAEQRARVEARVRAALSGNALFRDCAELHVNHTVADNGTALPVMSDQTMELQTKSLLVETPKIGGIVGIGVQADVLQDETRALVMDSILSTLLNVVGSVRAIHKYTKDLEFYATRDPLTQLYNQRVFWELLEYETSRAGRHEQSFALLVIDLDNFKSINDSYGHHTGDRFLQEFADTVRRALRAEDVLARYGGDEFVVLLPEVAEADAYTAAERILEAAAGVALTLPDGIRVKASVSIGLALYPQHGTNRKDLFLLADNMMYKAKGEGKNRVALPSEAEVVEAYRKIGEKNQIVLRALEERRIRPYFQPIMASASGRIEAVEVLSRIQIEDGIMEAGEFIELAEQMGVIHKLDYQVMDLAMAEARRVNYQGLLFINLSARAMVLSEFLHEVKTLVARHDLHPERIVFEITERETIKNISLLTKFVAALKLDGFRLAVDDFGSGFSSYHYLKHFPIDFLKIEGEFVLNMVKSQRDAAFVRSMVTLARELGIHTVAEHVEDEAVLRQASAAGVNYMQGWHVGRPAPQLEFPPPGT
ncbi:MAG: bifunctional diguanylate cyclase/phosphodiesterase [Pseudomonadota bacterium]